MSEADVLDLLILYSVWMFSGIIIAIGLYAKCGGDK